MRSSTGDLHRAAGHFLAAATAAGPPSETVDLLRCAAAGMSVIAGTQTPAEARAVAKPCVSSGRADVVCWARNTLAVAAVSEGAYDEVVEHARVAASILDDRYVRPLGFLIPHAWLMTGLRHLDRYDEARQAGERARARAERRGDVGLLVQVMAATCGRTWAEADWDETVAEIDAALLLMEDTGVVTHTILFRALGALMALERGRFDEARAHLEAAEASVASGTLHLFGIDILALVRARRLEAERELDAARDLLAGAWEATAALRGLIQWRLIGPALVRLCVATGRDAQAAVIADQVCTVAARSTSPSAAATARRARGLATRDTRLLVEAADALLATPRRIEAAGACEDALRRLLETDRRSSHVERLLHVAEECYLRAGAIAAVARLGDVREQAGLGVRAVPSGRARFGWSSLTPKELAVVRLVSLGRSNPDIAAELVISRRTVEVHLSHIFQKVEVSNRTQLARKALEAGAVST